ncbi:hypothetical protein BurJ1DRAFT_0021 [Burkholderiales bacterium JOSHI_001]|nr:hypothetical protein BurJ1DRAFT_0021 [Burkholderiales bacterium JOSHI_001]
MSDARPPRRIHPLLLVVLAATALWALLGSPPGADDDNGVELAAPARGVTAAAALNAAPAARGGPAAAPAAPAAWPGAREVVPPDSGRGLMGRPPAPPPLAARAQPAVAARPAVAPVAVVAAPQAPAVPAGPPLLLMGVVQTETPEPQVFFTLGERLFQARVGETIDGRFRVESITAAKVVLTVLPDNNRVEIPIATATPGG